MPDAIADDLRDLLGPTAGSNASAFPEAESRAPSPSGGFRAMVGGAYEGAERFGHLANWTPIIAPANAEIIPDKPVMDARARDVVRNEGSIAGAVALAKDHIAGEQYLLNAKPQSRVLFGTEDSVWETEFADEVEAKFSLYAEGEYHWGDAQRINTLTGLVRLAIGSFALTGEVLASSEWMAADGRPFQSAVLMLDPDRLCNPNFSNYLPNIAGGVERDRYGAPVAYHILDRHPSDWISPRVGSYSLHWRRVMARKPNWGRRNILHVFEMQRPDQARGVSELVSALSEIKMLKEFRKIELQRAVVAATYAATIESDLPSGDVYATMGGADGQNPSIDWAETYLDGIAAYNDAAKALRVDGVKIPVLMPGTKLRIQAPGAESPLGETFETSMLRHIAASLGMSYEQLSRDFSKTNYSSGKAALGQTELHLAARKKLVADGAANFAYWGWFEEAVNKGQIETMKRRRMPSFYEGLNADAYCSCDWIGAGRGQVDEFKETQAATMRLRSMLSTHEYEIARIHGKDWRRVAKQISRERDIFKELDLPSVYETEPSNAENAASGEPREAQQ